MLILILSRTIDKERIIVTCLFLEIIRLYKCQNALTINMKFTAIQAILSH